MNVDGDGAETPTENGGDAGEEAPSGSGETNGDGAPSESGTATGDEESSEDKGEAGDETSSESVDGAEDANETDSSDKTDEGDDSNESGDTEDGDDAEEPDGDENQSENPEEDSEAEDSDAGNENEPADDEINDADALAEDGKAVDDEFESFEFVTALEPAQTSALSWSFFSARANSGVQLAEGTHEKWIDRILIPSEQSYARALYNALVEGADNDGDRDILIDDSYYADGSYTFYAIKCDTQSDVDNAIEKWSEIYTYAQAAVDAFDRDHPEVFWIRNYGFNYSGRYNENHDFYVSFNLIMRYRDDTEGIYIDIRKDNFSTETAIKDGIRLRDSQVSAIRSAVSGVDTVGRIKGFNNWLTKNNQYNTTISNNGSLDFTNHMAWECLSALLGQEGAEGPVCEGYARAFKVLCDSENIPCVLVDGYGTSSLDSDGEAHMWNNVRVGDAWYAVDVTWNDPVGSGASGATSGRENEGWLLVGSGTEIGGLPFAVSHKVENHVTEGGVQFTNGPVLSTERYVIKPNAAIVFPQDSQSVVYSGSQANVVAPTVTKEDGTKAESPSITYSYRRNGAESFTDGRPVDVGTYEVKAKVAEGADYAAGESSNTLTLTITQAPLTITAADQKNIESGDPISADVSKASADKLLGNDKLTGCEFSVEGSYVNVGSYDITVKNAQITRDGKDVTGNYNISYVKGTLTVTQATPIDKTNKNQSIAMGDGKFEAPSFEDKNGTKVSGTVSYTYGGEACSESELVSKLSKLKEGDTGKISYTFNPGSSNYKVPAQGTITFTIVSISFMRNNVKATLENTVTVKNASPVYGDAWEQVLSLNSGLVAKFKDGQDADASHFKLNVSGTIGQAGNVTYRVLYSGTISGTSFQNVTVCEGTVSVQKAPLTITVNDHAVTYGDAPSNNGVSYDGFRNGDDANSLSGTLSYNYGGYNAQSNAGEYVITASGLSSNNYEITYNPGKLTVAKRVVDVKWQGADKVTYDGKEHMITASVADASSIVNGDVVQITCTGNKGTSAGTYNAVAAVSNLNYEISEGTRSKAFTIEPRKLAFIWSGDTRYTYDGKQHGVTVILDEGSLVTGDKVDFTYEDTKGVNAGEYTARVMSASNPNYTVAGSETAVMKWVIERRSIAGAIVALDQTVLTYNAEPQTKIVDSVTLTVDNEKKALDAKTEYMIEGATNTDAGEYTLTVTGIGNYIGSVTEAYEIKKANELVNKPAAENMSVKTSAEGLEGVPLPKGWKWEETDTELIPGGSVTVRATVSNRDNYDIPDAKEEDFYVTYEVGKLPELMMAATDIPYTIGVGNGVTIKSTGDYDCFVRVEVDGKEIDKTNNYTLERGSTILTFTKSYMDSLSVGKHTVELFYKVGSVSVEMTVARRAEPSTPPTTPTNPETTTTTVDVTTTAANAAGAVLSPKTGQEDMMYMYWLIALAVLAGAGICAKAADKNRKSAK